MGRLGEAAAREVKALSRLLEAELRASKQLQFGRICHSVFLCFIDVDLCRIQILMPELAWSLAHLFKPQATRTSEYTQVLHVHSAQRASERLVVIARDLNSATKVETIRT